VYIYVYISVYIYIFFGVYIYISVYIYIYIYISVYIRYFRQANHYIYGHIRCIYTVLANPTNVTCGFICNHIFGTHTVGAQAMHRLLHSKKKLRKLRTGLHAHYTKKLHTP
jgi:hypothetical protein